jgi:hypothetical protein
MVDRLIRTRGVVDVEAGAPSTRGPVQVRVTGVCARRVELAQRQDQRSVAGLPQLPGTVPAQAGQQADRSSSPGPVEVGVEGVEQRDGGEPGVLSCCQDPEQHAVDRDYVGLYPPSEVDRVPAGSGVVEHTDEVQQAYTGCSPTASVSPGSSASTPKQIHSVEAPAVPIRNRQSDAQRRRVLHDPPATTDGERRSSGGLATTRDNPDCDRHADNRTHRIRGVRRAAKPVSRGSGR